MLRTSILFLLLIFCLAACGSDDTNGDTIDEDKLIRDERALQEEQETANRASDEEKENIVVDGDFETARSLQYTTDTKPDQRYKRTKEGNLGLLGAINCRVSDGYLTFRIDNNLGRELIVTAHDIDHPQVRDTISVKVNGQKLWDLGGDICDKQILEAGDFVRCEDRTEGDLIPPYTLLAQQENTIQYTTKEGTTTKTFTCDDN